MTGSTEGAEDGTAGGGVTARGGIEVKGVTLELLIGC